MVQYRLLRSNKESGPYTKEQLVQMGFKPYDLVWVEGKCASWRYPSEIAELQAYAPVIEEQPFDRFYKKPAAKAINITTAAANINTATIQNTAEPVAVKKEKPRYRVAASWNRVDPIIQRVEPVMQKPEPITQRTEPVRLTTEPFIQVNTVAAPVAEIAEKKTITSPKNNIQTVTVTAEEVYAKYQPKTATTSQTLPKKSVAENPTILETNFSQSLDEIKERYVETILKPRQKGIALNFPKRYFLLALIIPAAGVCMWLAYKAKSSSQKNDFVNQTSEVKQANQPVKLNIDDDNNAADPNTAANDATPVNNQPAAANNNAVVKKLDAVGTPLKNEKTSLVKVIKPAGKQLVTGKGLPAAVKPFTIFTAAKNKPYTAENAATNSVATPPVTKPVQPPVTTPAVTAAKKRIEDYVHVNNVNKSTTDGVQDMKLKVQNVTDAPIDLAVVEIQYFGANGKLQKGETVYVNNIAANQTLQVKVPDSKTATSISYKVSMISSEEKTLIAD